jgi:hypothetical protein
MAGATVTRSVSVLGPDATVDAALVVADDFARAGFGLADYRWLKREPSAICQIELDFEPERRGAIPPEERSFSGAERDGPVRWPIYATIALIALILFVLALSLWSEHNRQMELCLYFSDLGDYCR